ncbi:MAG: hypothetical protein ABSB75_02550 [Candidatus Limnocylindrales bacterium]
MYRKLASLAFAAVLSVPMALGIAHVTAAPVAAANYCSTFGYDYLRTGREIGAEGVYNCTFNFVEVQMITEIQKYNPVTGGWEWVTGARWSTNRVVSATKTWGDSYHYWTFQVTGLKVRSMSWGCVLPQGSNQWWWPPVGYGLIVVTR